MSKEREFLRRNVEKFAGGAGHVKYHTHPSKQVGAPRQIEWGAKWLEHSSMVLDVGGGYGFQAAGIAARVPGMRVVGLDVSFDSLRERAADYPALGPNVVADMRFLPFAEHSFDGAVFFGALHHTLHPRDVLDECRRVVRPGSRVLLVEPNSLSMVLRRKGMEVLPDSPECRLSLPFVKQQIEDAGFGILHSETRSLSIRLLLRLFRESLTLQRLGGALDSILLRVPGLRILGSISYIVAEALPTGSDG